MKRILFNVFCSGIYQTYLDVDDDFCEGDVHDMSDEDFEKVHAYVCEHLDEAPTHEIEWTADIDVDCDDILEVYQI